MAAIVMQAVIGYVQYFTGVPVLLVGFHILGSILVLLAVMAVHLGMVIRPPLEQPGAPGVSGRHTPGSPDDHEVTGQPDTKDTPEVAAL